MKKLAVAVLACLLSFPAWADINIDGLINKVTLPLQAEQWVTTQTALVNVMVNAAVTDQGMERMQDDILQQLKRLSDKGEWHIVSFDRQQDKSGLESVQILAQARLQQADLGNLRAKAKSISKPGVTFTIYSVQFTPSEDELRQANTALRNNIYQQAKAEIDTLNKTYPDQKYYLYQINFFTSEMPMPMAQNTLFGKQRMDAMVSVAGSVAPAPQSLSVGNKLQLQASVIIASFPDQLMQKAMPH